MLEILWFVLIAVLFTGFFFLEGFDYGVGTLLPFLGRNDDEKRILINSIGPFWDGNEVWLLTAGGAMFASFPHWYATLFSALYLPLVFMLVFLIYRGVSFEFRHLEEGEGWKKTWDNGIFIGSAGPALLWGVAFANLIRGLPIDGSMTYTGGFFNLLNPFALIGGIFLLLLFSLHGANFLGLRTQDEILERVGSQARKLWLPVLLLALVYGVWALVTLPMSSLSLTAAIIMIATVAASGILGGKGLGSWAFSMTGVAIVAYSVMHFALLFPNVLLSSLNPEWNISIQAAASSPTTLKTMTIIACIFVPIVLVYQIWTFRVFRQRVGSGDTLKY